MHRIALMLVALVGVAACGAMVPTDGERDAVSARETTKADLQDEPLSVLVARNFNCAGAGNSTIDTVKTAADPCNDGGTSFALIMDKTNPISGTGMLRLTEDQTGRAWSSHKSTGNGTGLK